LRGRRGRARLPGVRQAPSRRRRAGRRRLGGGRVDRSITRAGDDSPPHRAHREVMRRTILAAAACLSAFGAFGALGAAVADTPPTGTADISVSFSVFTRASDGTYAVGGPDPSTPIVIGDSEQ